MEQLTLLGAERLFEEISSQGQLQTAWKLVKRNGGVPGIDAKTIEEFGQDLDRELEQLSEQVRKWEYRPSPVRRVEIPKPGSWDKRKLGIPTVRDRVLQQSIRLSLEPLYEPKFSEWSFGFRPGRGQHDAVKAAQRIVESGKNWVVDIDLEKFFDRIHHDRLIHTLSKRVTDNRVLRLIGMTLRSGILQGEHYEPSTAGSPQGSPLSPLLSNIVLDELDKELESRGLSFCRYADDAKIYVGSQKSANRVMRSVSNFIESHLKLTVNRLKSKVAQTWDVVFLGFVITRKTIRISKKSMKRAFVKLKELIPRATHLSLEQQMKRFSQWYLGWANYYKLTRYPYQLQLLEAHARRRFRAQLISNTKRKRTLVRKLAARGVSLMQAKQAVYGKHRRRWRLSRTDAAHRAWGTAWFQTLKFPVLSTAKLPHWYSPRIRKAW